MKCQRCNLPIFEGAAGYVGLQCKCWSVTPPNLTGAAQVPYLPYREMELVSRAELAALRKELEEWRKLRDPVTLHVNLLRGFPAKLDRATFLHLAGDDAAVGAA